ncbi:MAG TPA: methylmalonyl Co-A mutase-associated GTPase MeaB [Cyclobacteriaceae bacterium]
MAKKRLKINEYVDGIINQNRLIVSKAITLLESKLTDDNLLADKIIDKLVDKTGHSFRLGITGVPGVGKSTFIDAIGKKIVKDHKLAILSIDPSSSLTKGSILGDKTRMSYLSTHPKVFIRPSPTGNTLGGVAQRTREVMLLFEAAGYDFIIIETVGVGQSETAVKGMVDFFLLLMLAGAGDDLQGMKRGIMEMADAIVVNKADGENLPAVNKAIATFNKIINLLPRADHLWETKVRSCSSINDHGIEEILNTVEEYEKLFKENNLFYPNRDKQYLSWFEELIRQKLINDFHDNKNNLAKMQSLRNSIIRKEITVKKAVHQLFEEN